ncbi:MAG: hypothetical protein K6G27_10535, partial [Lachnospiraceae bacterium]|nr:hypothetical protein [Lachnospiraceae bacterium]
EHLGYPDCFWDILTRCPVADYYAFADQDDVWEPEKLSSMIERFNDKQVEDDSPLLYIHDYDNYDAMLNRMSVHRLGSTGVMNERSILFYTYASGFSIAINNGMRNMLNNMTLIGKGMYHDELCIWLAYLCGHIVYDDRALVKYRRHEATVTEYGNGTGTLISNWIRREIKGDEFVWKCERIRSFLEMMKDKNVMSDKILHEWSLLSGSDMTFTRYWQRLFYPHRLRPSLGGEMALRLLFLSAKGTCK